MTKRAARDAIYRGRRFPAETIELCVRWYITYRLSYRDLVAMMAEQGIVVSHTTILRWVLHYVPEYERRWARYARSPGSSWHMDETAVAVRGGRHDLYRAVDRRGKSVASLLCSDRSMEAAQAFFRTAVSLDGVPWPAKINVDGNSATHRGLRLLGAEDGRWRSVVVRARRYLNNVVEQDHRAIKQRCASMLGLKTFPLRGDHAGGHRTRPSHSQAAVFAADGHERAGLFAEGAVGRRAGRLRCTDVPGRRSTFANAPELNPPFSAGARVRRLDGPARYPRKISFGGNLYLLVRPEGGRYWHYHYRYGGKRKTLSLGTYPDVPTAQALLRHSDARRLLAIGIDPSLRRRELRRVESGALVADSAVPGKWLQTGGLVYGRFEIVTESDLNPCFVNLTRAAEAAKRPAKIHIRGVAP